MTSTSSESVVVRGLPESSVDRTWTVNDLRSGRWTRLGSSSVLGDAVAEHALHDLAERTRTAARAEGYAVGWAEGRRRGLADARTQQEAQASARAHREAQALAVQQSAAEALEAAAVRVEEILGKVVDDLASRAVDVALEVVEALLERELELSCDPGRDALARALSHLPQAVPVTVRLNPEDLAALDRDALGRSELADRKVSLVPDDALRRGDAVAETEDALVDATVGSALARLREVLGR